MFIFSHQYVIDPNKVKILEIKSIHNTKKSHSRWNIDPHLQFPGGYDDHAMHNCIKKFEIMPSAHKTIKDRESFRECVRQENH
jgi:hypothetical protein